MSDEHPFPNLIARGTLWLLAVVAFVGVRETVLVSRSGDATELAIRQMQPDNAVAEELRAACQGRAWLLSGWAVLAFAALAAGGLFGPDLARLAWVPPGEPDGMARPQSQSQADESASSPEQGELR